MSFRSLGLFSAIALVLAALVLTVVETGCSSTPRSPERAAARAAVETTASATVALDEACALVAIAYDDLEMAQRCVKAYDAARVILIGVANGVDSWDRFEQTRTSIRCAVAAALAELQTMASLIRGHSQNVPPIVDDARALVAQIGACQ